MSYWVVIHSAPVRQFFADRDTLRAHATAGVSADVLLLPLPAIETALSVDGPQASRVSISLRNSARQATHLLGLPPLGARAEIRDAAGVVFAGRVVQVDLGEVATLEVQS